MKEFFSSINDVRALSAILNNEEHSIEPTKKNVRKFVVKTNGGNNSAFIGKIQKGDDRETTAKEVLTKRVLREFCNIETHVREDGTLAHEFTTLSGNRFDDTSLPTIVDGMIESDFQREEYRWLDDETACLYVTVATMLEEQNRGEQFDNTRRILDSVFKGTRLTATLPTKGEVQAIAKTLPGNGENGINEQIRGAAIVRQFYRTLIPDSEEDNSRTEKENREIERRFQYVCDNLLGFIQIALYDEIYVQGLDEKKLSSDERVPPYYRVILALYNHFIHDEPMMTSDNGQPVIGSLEEERRITRRILSAEQQRTHKMGEATDLQELASGKVPQAEQAVLDAMQPAEKTTDRTQ